MTITLQRIYFHKPIVKGTASINNINESFFFRSHTFDIRNSMQLLQFKIKLAKHFWNMTLTDNEQPEDEWSFQSSDEGGSVFKFLSINSKIYILWIKSGQ